jgi:type I restriction enzyme S subunit
METLQPKLRFSEYTGNWHSKILDDISTINMGQSPSSSSYNTEMIGMPLIQGNADIKNRISFPRNWTSEPTKICEIGDLILTVRAPVGAVAKSNHKACIGRGVCSIKNKANSNIDFIYQFLLDFENKWSALEQGSTFTAVSGSEIKNLKLNIPSLEEQTKIANFLSSVDEKLNLLKEKKSLLEDYKKGIMQKIFNQEIRFKEDNGNDYVDWEQKTFGEMSTIRRGASPRPITDAKWFDENSTIGWVRISDVSKSNKYLLKTEQYLSKEGVNKSRLVTKGNLIMSICATIGKPIYTDFDVCIHDGFVVFENLKGYREYFYYYLQYIQKNWYNYGQPGTQVNLNSDIVSNELLLFPSIDEQTKIANFLSAIDEKIELVSNQIQDTQEYKKGLLQKMFV